MAPRPEPPQDSQELGKYSIGYQVYYFRSGKWRIGKITKAAGTTDDSPRYLIEDDANKESYLTPDCDMRGKNVE
ncbi:hypothetical protein MMC14_010508 [Varicellaria rhodocarpa]|nr:hypothetical protein [Varicellaria rhodocarpa]